RVHVRPCRPPPPRPRSRYPGRSRSLGSRARLPPGPTSRATPPASLVDDLEQDLRGARVVRLAEPEDRLLAKLLVPLRLGDPDQRVERLGLVALRVHEDQLLFHLRAL